MERVEGLRILIKTLKEHYTDSEEIYEKIIKEPIYADLSKAEFEKYL